jgi:mono/diheme cytochrome c family protein
MYVAEEKTMKRISIPLLVVAAALLVASAAMADAGPDGTAIFKSKCAMCHGPDGKGQTAMGKTLHLKDMSSEEVQNMKNADLQKIIAEGKGKMPAFKDKLDQASIDAVIEFIRTLKK